MQTRRSCGFALAAILALVPLSADSARAGLAASPWPIFQHDAQHTGRTSLIGPSGTLLSPPPTVWKYRGKHRARLLSQPTVGADGTIYIGRARHPLCAVDPVAGDEKWCAKQNNKGTFADRSSPTVADNGMIYIGGRDNDLWAIRPDGTLQWKFHVPTDGDVSTAPLVSQSGAVFMGSDSLQAGWFYRMQPGDPNPLAARGGPTPSFDWQTVLRGGIKNVAPAESHDGSAIYVTVNGNAVIALDPNGDGNGGARRLWRTRLERSVKGARGPNYTPVVADDGKILVAFDFGVYALNPGDGSLCWKFDQTDDNHFEAPPALGWDGRIFAAGSRSEKGRIFAIMPPASCGSTPTLLWSHPLPGPLRNSAPVVDGNGDVYIAARKAIFKLAGNGDGNGGGSVIWKNTIARDIFDSTVMIPSPGRLLAANHDAFLYAIGQ